MSFVVLDTDVASNILRGRDFGPLHTKLTGHAWCISFVTVGELTKWTVLRSWGPRKLATLASWRQGVVTLPYSERVAIHGASCKPAPSVAVVPARSTTRG